MVATNSFNGAPESRPSHAQTRNQPRSGELDGGGGVIPVGAGCGVTATGAGGVALIRAESMLGVTIGLAGISSGATVRVAIVGWRGSLAQSFQLFATWR
jgi:hypothetical protein